MAWHPSGQPRLTGACDIVGLPRFEWLGPLRSILRAMFGAQTRMGSTRPEPPVELLGHCSIEMLLLATTGVVIAPKPIRGVVRETYIRTRGPVRGAVRCDRPAPSRRSPRGARCTRRSQRPTNGRALGEVVKDVVVQMEQRPREIDGLTRNLAASELCQ